METNKKANLRKILLILATLFVVLSICNISQAETIVTDADAVKNMPTSGRIIPQHNFDGSTGLLPQYFGGAQRTVTLPDSRWSIKTSSWAATMDGKVVYCSSYESPVRYAQWDDRTYYANKNTGIELFNTGSTSVSGRSVLDWEHIIKGNIYSLVNEMYHLTGGNEWFVKWNISSPTRNQPSKVFNMDSEDNVKIEVELPDGVSNDDIAYAILTSDNWMGNLPRIGTATDPYIGCYRSVEEGENAAEAQATAMFDNIRVTRTASYTGNKIIGYTARPYNSPIEVDVMPTAQIGPIYAVLEPEERSSVGGYEKTNSKTYENDKYAFIFSSSENGYGLPEYAKRYSINDIQSAYWLLLQDDGGRTVTYGKTEGGVELHEKAVQYEQFKNETYNPSIIDKDARVVADRNKRQYIVGPYQLQYPEYEDISYVKALAIRVGNGKELLYGEEQGGKEKKDFEIVLEGSGAKGSNGKLSTLEYPHANQSFFIVVSESKLGISGSVVGTQIELHTFFEHIDQTYASYEEYEAKINYYRYNGYVLINGTPENSNTGVDHKMLHTTIHVNVTAPVAKTRQVTDYERPVDYAIFIDQYGHRRTDLTVQEFYDQINYQNPGWNLVDTYKGYPYKYTEYYNEDYEYVNTDIDLYIPYIKLGEKVWTSQDAQKLVVIGEGESKAITIPSQETSTTIGGNLVEWDSTQASGSGNAYRTYVVVDRATKIDIRMELGGQVWLDENGGKEGIANGIKDSEEKLIPGMKVTLSDGQTTITDSNGEYRFKNLDPMQQYSVTFEYNGQYYQPTTWEGSSSWYSSAWPTNSNAKDNESERLTFNAKFASVGAYHGAYENSKQSFTRKELEEAGAINQYGLPAGGGSAEMNQYVNDSMMKAYTVDLYPTPPVFVINMDKNGAITDGSPYSSGKYAGLLRKYTSAAIEILYDKAFHINLGLDEREQSDLAVNKDVDHVTLEINGQRHTYTYDSLENKIEEDGTWLVGVAPSDLGSADRARYRALLRKMEEEIPASYDSTNYEAQERNFNKNYGTSYTRELYKSDYLYKVSSYGENYETEFGKSKDDELEIYVTYKITVRNQALTIRAKVDELVDYYDKDLEYIDDRSYITIKQIKEYNDDGTIKVASDEAQQYDLDGNEIKYSVRASDKSIYSSTSTIDGYDNLYITGLAHLNDKNDRQNYLGAGERAYVYLTFKVKKDEDVNQEKWLRLDEDMQTGAARREDGREEVGKENIIEVNGYSTQYAAGTRVPNIGDVSYKPAGIIDRDSNSGNAKDAIKYKNVTSDGNELNKLEDDTGKAPNIKIILYRGDDDNRVIAGNIFEDERNQTIDLTTTGNGIKEENETSINGVTVQLVEILENGKEYVWREFGDNAEKTAQIGGSATIGKGTGSGTVSKETPIINITFEDGTKLVQDYEFDANHNGDYVFTSFMPGKYVVRFIYGDTVKTVTPASLNMGGLNAKSYNGQDYKSTIYQKGINQNLNVETRNKNNWVNTDTNLVYIWNQPSTWKLDEETIGKTITQVATFKPDASNNETVTLPDTTKENWEMINVNEQKGYIYDIAASEVNANVSDAKDIESRRNEVNNYSSMSVTNYIAEVLASHKADYITMNDRQTLLNDLMQNTSMRAETGMMVIELEYDSTKTLDQTKNNTASYIKPIKDVNFGLEERPKSALALNKTVTNVKLVLANGSVLFDAKDTATNVLWRHHGKYDTKYNGNVLDTAKFGSIENIRNINANKFGLVQLTMDEELMHGATIQITYNITVSNVGEVDYKDNSFYYTGEKSNNAKIVTTRADKVIDYVANNLQFNANTNNSWKTIEKAEINTQNLVNARLNDKLETYNTIIVTDQLRKDLIPEIADTTSQKANSSTSVPLVLTQLITAENDTDDLTYRNVAEIVQTSNTVGRRMEYSVVGNQDPTAEPLELDTDRSEIVRILPPFGNAGMPIMIIAIIITAICMLIGGIIFIKKKVLRK